MLNKWPLQSECNAFYGNPRNASNTAFSVAWLHENIVPVAVPWLLFDGKNHYAHISIHKNCAASLERVLQNVWSDVGKTQAAIDTRHYDVYSGSLNFRNMRTHNQLSMHSYGCAIDWDAPDNRLGSLAHKFVTNELLLEKFREEGWICGIDWRGNSIDAMHVQAARVG
jgi:hypothetical protein